MVIGLKPWSRGRGDLLLEHLHAGARHPPMLVGPAVVSEIATQRDIEPVWLFKI